MHSLVSSPRHLVLLALLGASACSASPGEGADEDTSTEDAALYGGFPAKSKKLDAVGSIVELSSDKDGGVYLQKCSGTLIAPHTVLTAAHCVQKYKGKYSVDYTEQRFRIGFDANAPAQELPIVGGYVGPIYDGGLTGRGADVGLFFLGEDVTDVEPIPADTEALGDADLGKTFAIVGYGQEDPLDPVGAHRERQMGSLRLEALQGDPKKVLWSSTEEMAAWLTANTGIEISASSLTAFWDAPQHVLLAGQVGFFSSIHNGAQAGRGDSGGPILRLGSGGLRVSATVGGSWAINLPTGTQVLFGGTYGGLVASAENADFVVTKSGEHCRGVPAGGYCNGDIAVQCNEEGDFTQAITSFDCRELGMWCGEGDDGATCVDPVSVGNATTCALVGVYKDPNNVAYEFKDDGTYTIRNVPRGHYSFDSGLLQLDDDTGLCQGSSSGIYTAAFNDDCSAFTFDLTHDGCRLRGESWDLTKLVRQP